MGKKAVPKKAARKRLVSYGIVLAFLAGTGAIIVFFYSDFLFAPALPAYTSATRLNILVENSTGGLQEAAIPASIGIDPSLWNYHELDQYGVDGHAPILTKDTFGFVLVESSLVRDYTLGDFFKIWGKTFNSTCIEVDTFYCNGGAAQYQLSMYVNGSLNDQYDAYVLRDQDVIRIEYSSPVL